MSKLSDRIALLNPAHFLQTIKCTFSKIKENQTESCRRKKSAEGLPITFISDQSHQAKKKLAHHVIDVLKKLSFTPIYIDPWLHKTHTADGYLQKAIYKQARKSKIHRKSLFTHTLFRFTYDNGAKLLLLILSIIFAILVWEVDQKHHSALVGFFSKSAISMLVLTLLLRFIASPISNLLNRIFFKEHDHTYAISDGEMDKLISKSYHHNAPYVILIEHLSWCDPNFIVDLLNRAMILSRRGILVIVSGNPYLLNSAIRKANAMIEDLNKSSAEEFYKERYAFNYYFGFQLYNSHILQHNFLESEQPLKKNDIDPVMQHNLVDLCHDIISTAITSYDITHDQLIGLYTSIDFYQRFLSLSSESEFKLITTFLIAYRYDRYYLKTLLSHLKNAQNNEPLEKKDGYHHTTTRNHIFSLFNDVFSHNIENTFALTQLTSDLLFIETKEEII